jgi:hypothetical protein
MELAFDQGHVATVDAKLDLAEIEIELKHGDPREAARLDQVTDWLHAMTGLIEPEPSMLRSRVRKTRVAPAAARPSRRMLGRCATSQIGSASINSFFCRLTRLHKRVGSAELRGRAAGADGPSDARHHTPLQAQRKSTSHR